MSIVSKKVGVILAAAAGAAFLAMSGCATQASGAATPENLPSNCKVIASCKGMTSCKGRATCKGHTHSRCDGKQCEGKTVVVEHDHY